MPFGAHLEWKLWLVSSRRNTAHGKYNSYAVGEGIVFKTVPLLWTKTVTEKQTGTYYCVDSLGLLSTYKAPSLDFFSGLSL